MEISKEEFGVIGNAKSWISFFLSSRTQRVIIEHKCSKNFQLDCGVPQGSCLGPILFILYASGIFNIVKKHLPNAHGYADDTQLYLSFKPSSKSTQDEALKAIETCIAEVRAWMITHRLKINDSKTEFLIIGSRQQLSKVSIDSITIGASSVQPVSSVRNLGAWFDENLSMTTHVGKVCSKAFRGLYSIKQIRKYLSQDATKVLIHAFVTSHLDYCNSLLCGIPQYQYSRLQRILNAAARLVCLVPKFNHITPVLYDLHWLPVFYRIKFKIILLVHRSLFNWYCTCLLKEPAQVQELHIIQLEVK